MMQNAPIKPHGKQESALLCLSVRGYTKLILQPAKKADHNPCIRVYGPLLHIIKISPSRSIDLLLQISEKVRVKEPGKIHIQAVADFLHRGDCHRLITPADNIVQGRLGDAAAGTQRIDAHSPLITQFKYP